MNTVVKQEFLARLRRELAALPNADVEERLNFYSEMIDDRMEEGLPEEAAVAAVGPVEEIVAQILGEVTAASLTPKKEHTKRTMKAWEILLLILGSPIWLSLGIAAAAVALSVYVSLWAVLVSFWAVFGAFVGCAFGGLMAGIVLACFGNVNTGIALLGAGILLAGLSIFTFFGCKAATCGTLLLTKKTALWIKKRFAKKEAAQ